MSKRHPVFPFTLLLVLLGCSVPFVADYNATIAGDAVQLQEKVEAYLTDLQRTANSPEGEYGRHAGFYTEVRDDIESIRTTASAARGNELTMQSLDLIGQNVDRLEKMHAEGITPAEVGIVARLLDTQLRMLVELQNDKKRKEI